MLVCLSDRYIFHSCGISFMRGCFTSFYIKYVIICSSNPKKKEEEEKNQINLNRTNTFFMIQIHKKKRRKFIYKK